MTRTPKTRAASMLALGAAALLAGACSEEYAHYPVPFPQPFYDAGGNCRTVELFDHNCLPQSEWVSRIRSSCPSELRSVTFVDPCGPGLFSAAFGSCCWSTGYPPTPPHPGPGPGTGGAPDGAPPSPPPPPPHPAPDGAAAPDAPGSPDGGPPAPPDAAAAPDASAGHDCGH